MKRRIADKTGIHPEQIDGGSSSSRSTSQAVEEEQDKVNSLSAGISEM